MGGILHDNSHVFADPARALRNREASHVHQDRRATRERGDRLVSVRSVAKAPRRLLMTNLKTLLILTLVLFLARPIASRAIASSQGGKAAVDSVPSFAEPAVSPDRSEIAFVSGGDIWTVAAAGGEA